MSRVWKGSDRPTHEKFPLGHVTLLKIFNPFNISGIDEATLIKFGKTFPQKGAWSGSRDRLWYEATLFKFRKCIKYGECHTRVNKNLAIANRSRVSCAYTQYDEGMA